MSNQQNNQSANNRRIVKNTIYMYIRMVVMMVISLYTSRVVLNTLGIDDYGVYNIVGGIIVFFSFLNNGLSNATRRYITADIADSNIEKGRHTFNICLKAHALVALIVFLLAEIVGPIVIWKYLNIPEGREIAAQMVYQISVFTAILGILQSPYGTAIVAYEKMDIYAYFTIIDVILKLGVIFLVQYIVGDKLIIYALLIMAVVVVNVVYFSAYAIHKFPTCHFERYKNRAKLREVFSFMGWNVLGQSATVVTNQGVSVLVNMYFNVAANAAMGVSNSITNIVSQFVANFQVAFNPQIIKSYNTGDFDYLRTLVQRASKISSYLILIFLIPLMFEADKVLTLWLGEYPNYAVEFCIYTLFCMYLDAISGPLYMVVYSQTNIKKYQIWISSVYSLCFFFGWIALWLGAAPYSVIIARFVVFIALLCIRLYFVKQVFNQFNLREWIFEIVCKGLVIFLISSTVIYVVAKNVMLQSISHVMLVTIVSLVVSVPCMYIIGFSNSERKFVKDIVIKKIHR